MKPDARTHKGRRKVQEMHDRYADMEPENPDAPFMFTEGRYYLAMWYHEMPDDWGRFRNGGNVMFMVWRETEQPRTWYLKHRFRHYFTKGDAWDGNDHKTWKLTALQNMDEVEILHRMECFFRSISFVTTEPPERLLFQGDVEAVFKTIRQAKPKWMNVGEYDVPERKLGA